MKDREFPLSPKDGSWSWVPETPLQLCRNDLVCTFWHALEDETGKPARRPHEKVDAQVLKIVDYDEDKDRFRVQMVGDPVFDLHVIPHIKAWSKKRNSTVLFRLEPVYMEGAELRMKWPRQYEAWEKGDRPEADTGGIQIVFGHRKNPNDQVEFEVSYLSQKKAPKPWLKECHAQTWNDAALLTYWMSNPELRSRQSEEDPKVPMRPLRIIRHRSDEREHLFLIIQKVGGSEMEKDLQEIDVVGMLELDEELTQQYMEEKGLSIRSRCDKF
ncbi:hypothetical protein FBEOM_3791 [Fusarium beomiforme]|uniref:Uncharacterized protein n=1 Tax=Fusarium beomiforme TaxID=44412 RepID=A0A9P5APB0_9HYPO|nr:hypothetical protein FBEOM_3791 [Fusarium beomiforme]